jgi:2-oxoglutarate dehydrogenase E1 component
MHLEGTAFLYGANSAFIEELYQRYLKDPNAVEPSWRHFFAGLGDDLGTLEAERRGASWSPRGGHGPDLDGFGPALDAVAPQLAPSLVGAPAAQVRQATLDSLRALMLIRSYRVRGHLKANLDPLGLAKIAQHPELDPRTYGFTEADWDRPIFLNHVLGLETATLREIMDVLNRTYCGSVGVEFMHHQGPEQKAWIQQNVEGRFARAHYGAPEKRRILAELTEAEGFERFLHLKYTGTKRFGLEGAESLIPAMEALVSRAAELGVREISLGMAHRGRLNVLANFMGKPFQAIFSEFQGGSAHPQDVEGSGDVKYHLGTSTDRDFNGHTVHLSLSANPSHLEASDPVVLGKARAKQTQLGDVERRQVMAVLLHGDAAFAGQGLVAECFALSDLKGYRTGGTVHLIINNQIGFTTNPTASRSSP